MYNAYCVRWAITYCKCMMLIWESRAITYCKCRMLIMYIKLLLMVNVRYLCVNVKRLHIANVGKRGKIVFFWKQVNTPSSWLDTLPLLFTIDNKCKQFCYGNTPWPNPVPCSCSFHNHCTHIISHSPLWTHYMEKPIVNAIIF